MKLKGPGHLATIGVIVGLIGTNFLVPLVILYGMTVDCFTPVDGDNGGRPGGEGIRLSDDIVLKVFPAWPVVVSFIVAAAGAVTVVAAGIWAIRRQARSRKEHLQTGSPA